MDGFSWALVGYDMDHVRRAFRRYVVEHSDIPAPADIIRLVKELRQSDGLDTPSVEQLRQYQARGIALTPRQQDALRQYEADLPHVTGTLAERIAP